MHCAPQAAVRADICHSHLHLHLHTDSARYDKHFLDIVSLIASCIAEFEFVASPLLTYDIYPVSLLKSNSRLFSQSSMFKMILDQSSDEAQIIYFSAGAVSNPLLSMQVGLLGKSDSLSFPLFLPKFN